MADHRVATQIHRTSARRMPVLLRRDDTDGQRGLQVQRPAAVLQGPGHRLGAVGPALHPRVQEEARPRGLGRARRQQEEATDLDPQGRRPGLPL